MRFFFILLVRDVCRTCSSPRQKKTGRTDGDVEWFSSRAYVGTSPTSPTGPCLESGFVFLKNGVALFGNLEPIGLGLLDGGALRPAYRMRPCTVFLLFHLIVRGSQQLRIVHVRPAWWGPHLWTGQTRALSFPYPGCHHESARWTSKVKFDYSFCLVPLHSKKHKNKNLI